MAIVNFYLNTEQTEALESFLQDGESLNLAAKRLLLERLENPETSNIILKSSNNIIDDKILEQSMEQLESKYLAKITTMATDIENLKEEINKINKPAIALPELEEHPEHTEPPNEKKSLTGGALARLLGKSPSAVSRWKERRGGLSPDGHWQYEAKSEKWISLE